MKEDQVRNLKMLLQRLDIVRDKIAARNEGKEKFNVFSCLLDSNDERYLHSRFISSLIDPRGFHGLKDVPLNRFVETLGSNFKYSADNIEIYPSSSDWGEYKNIDILLIDRSSKHAIIVENKIYASDSNHEEEGQLERYYRRIIEEDGIPQENIEIYYLTMDGHEPSAESVSTSSKYKELPHIVHCITYGSEILKWLQQCMQIACDKPYIRETIAQYINLIKEMTNDTEVEDRLEIIKIIARNDDTLASAKLLFDNYKHVQWHTIFDLFNDFYVELERRGYTCISKVGNKMIDDIVHGGPQKRKQYPSFNIKDKNGIIITVACDYDDYFYFGLKSNENKILDKEKVKSIVCLNEKCYVDRKWLFNRYFDCPDDMAIDIWDFSMNGTFRIINPNKRRETVKKYLDDMENTIYKEFKIDKLVR